MEEELAGNKFHSYFLESRSLLPVMSNPPTQAPSSEPPLFLRYLFKVGGSIVGFACNLIMHALIPRALGPIDYGTFSFLNQFFSKLVGFLSMGTAIAFYTKLSQRPTEQKLILFYFYIISLLILIVLVLLTVAFGLGIESVIWPDQQWIFICLAAVLGILIWCSDIINKMIDAFGQTITGERIKVVQKILGLTIILGLFVGDRLNLLTYFSYHFFITLLLIVLFLVTVIKSRHVKITEMKLKTREFGIYIREFYLYAAPLFIYSAFSFF